MKAVFEICEVDVRRIAEFVYQTVDYAVSEFDAVYSFVAIMLFTVRAAGREVCSISSQCSMLITLLSFDTYIYTPKSALFQVLIF